LNKIYQISPQNSLYFTAWYGVIDLDENELVYSGAGHPPVLLFSGNEIEELNSKAMMVGGMPETEYINEKYKLNKNDAFYLYSDGVYEFRSKDGKRYDYKLLENILMNTERRNNEELNVIYDKVNNLNEDDNLKDDFSILKIKIH
jgi:sigma-B regulation protein RsbU (phosphoserine phosphatase)